MDSYGIDLLERGKRCGVEIISMKALEVSHPAHSSDRCPWGHFGSNVKILALLGHLNNL